MGANRGIGWRALVTDRRTADALLVLACLLLTVLAVKGRWSVLPLPVIAAAGVVASASQWRRRRWPHLATVAGAAGYALSGNPGPLLVGLYSGAAYAPRRHVWALAVVGWSGFAGWALIDNAGLSWNDVATTAVATAVVVAVGVHVATRRALSAAWRERAERAETERQVRDERARSAERNRIARELHDVLAHKLSLIALHAGALELSSRGGPVRARDGAELIRGAAREALQELRYVLGLLQAEPPYPLPTGGEPLTDLTALVQAATQAGQRVELRDEAGTLPATTARVVYRIVQEGITNARKHAPDAPVTVSIRRRDEGPVTVVVNNPSPAGPSLGLPGSGAGLIGLAERLRLVGGEFHSGLVGGPAGDWRITAVVPWLELGDEAAERDHTAAAVSRRAAPGEGSA